MQDQGSIDLRQTFIYGTLVIGGTLILVPLILFFPFAVIAAAMHPLVAILATLITCLAGVYAVRRRSILLAVIFFVPCSIPALGFLEYWAEPLYIPRIWEPSEFHRVTGYPDFARAFDTAVAEGREWTRDPRAVATVFARGESGTAPTRCFVTHTSDTTATANVVTLQYDWGDADWVHFYRLQLIRTDGIWRPTQIDHAMRPRGDFRWR